MRAATSFKTLCQLLTVVLLFGTAAAARSHHFDHGAITIDHPYATPTVTGARTGAVYFRAIKNAGNVPDKLLSATSSLASRIELHEMRLENNVMMMREITGIDLPANSEIQLRHGQKQHLMLIDLKQPLVAGDTFDLRLRFERAGHRNVKVIVQKPKVTINHHH